ncbi:MAG TPA: tetratricopeptide repeat protein [Lacunisphaera sp.]|jgi:tetratricopeptide (TPR) repeat protein
MNETSLFRRTILGGACLLAALATGAIAAGAGSNRPELPAISRYGNLPQDFDRALHDAADKIGNPSKNPDAVRQLALLYHANRLFAEAKACYRVIAAMPPGLTARDHYYLADIAQNENDLATAQRELEAVVRLDPTYIPARLSLADTSFKSGEPDEAAKEYSAVLAIEANQPEAALGMARIELQRGDDDAAVARLEELTAGHPESAAAAALFAQVLDRRGETDRAIAMAQGSRQKPALPPADPWKDALLRDCYDVQRLSLTFEEYFKTGKMAEATPLLDRLAVLDPKGPITMMFAGFSHAKALQHVAAVREYYAALGSGGDPEKIAPLLVNSLVALGKLDEANALMADLYAKNPASGPITKAYAELAVRRGDAKLSQELLTKVLEKEPFLQAQNMSLANILWSSGDRDAAAKHLQRVASVYADDVPSRALLGEYFLGKSDPISAIALLEQAAKYVVPKTPAQKSLAALLITAYGQAANRESEKGNFASAADHYEKAARLDPTNLDAFAGQANACVMLKQFHRAAEALQKMATLQPDNPTIHLSLGDVVYQAGNPAEARRDWEKALQLDPAGETDMRSALNDRLSGRITADTFK